ncbi:proto-oncogene Mas-like [Podarcis raffonei]|uniref:proto-oncogene Mas-like n=1 Tax=Podarcis raffonei TaxID=65483 RepID=UPI0023293C9D|nr:proto-oncogene Mas-like [Podarcis raffonei]
MSNDGLGSWSTLNASLEEIGAENGTDLLTPQDDFDHELSPYRIADILIPILLISILLLSIFGIIGNGTVIWFLGFSMKRNPFTTFILHLAAADLGALISLFTFSIIYLLRSFLSVPPYMHLIVLLFSNLFIFMYNTGQYLLTAISMDRCVSVVFPLWHRCHRPPHFSTLVCATIWITSFLLTVISMIVSIFNILPYTILFQFLMNAILCLPLMTVSTLVLFIKVYIRSKQRKKGKALTAILLALLFFLFLAFPLSCIVLISFFTPFITYFAESVGFLCSCLNSSINPLIYFLIGRNKRARSRESMKVIFQRLFKEEENCREK